MRCQPHAIINNLSAHGYSLQYNLSPPTARANSIMQTQTNEASSWAEFLQRHIACIAPEPSIIGLSINVADRVGSSTLALSRQATTPTVVLVHYWREGLCISEH